MFVGTESRYQFAVATAATEKTMTKRELDAFVYGDSGEPRELGQKKGQVFVPTKNPYATVMI
jgi:hypothetical protein